jgi:hypothetical protein
VSFAAAAADEKDDDRRHESVSRVLSEVTAAQLMNMIPVCITATKSFELIHSSTAAAAAAATAAAAAAAAYDSDAPKKQH